MSLNGLRKWPRTSTVDRYRSVLKGLSIPHSEREHIRRRGRDLDRACCDRLYTAFTEQVWPDEVNKSPSWSSDDDVTAETRDWVDAIFQTEDPVYDEYANIPDLAGLEVKAKIIDELQSSGGWSLDSVQGELARKFDLAMGDQQLQTIARTETAAVLNRSQFVALEALPDDPVVKWVGPDDSRTTDLCRDLSDATSDGVRFSEFKPMMREYAESYPAGKTDRLEQGILHFQERYTIKRISI